MAVPALLFIAVLAGCAPQAPQQLTPAQRSALETHKAMVGKRYVFNGGASVCKSLADFDALAGGIQCGPESEGSFTVEDVSATQSGRVFLKIAYRSGDGFIDFEGSRVTPEDAYYGELRAKAARQADLARCLKETPRIGMSIEEARRRLCEPDHRNTDITGARVSEQWVYPGSMYLYFVDGRLASIQLRH